MSPPIVLLHGFTGCPASWDAVVGCLPPGLVTVRETLLGHGPGLTGEDGEGFFAEVDRIAGRLGGGARAGCAAWLCGYSLGARVALGLLVRHGERFCGASLVGVNPGLRDPAERSARAASDERWARMIEGDGLDAFAAAWEAQPLFASQASLPEPVRSAERARRRAHAPRSLARALRILGLAAMPDLRPFLPSVTVPVQLVAGAEDPKFVGLAHEVASLLPRASLHVIDGAGHNVPLEQPARLAALLLEAVGRDRGAAPTGSAKGRR